MHVYTHIHSGWLPAKLQYSLRLLTLLPSVVKQALGFKKKMEKKRKSRKKGDGGQSRISYSVILLLPKLRVTLGNVADVQPRGNALLQAASPSVSRLSPLSIFPSFPSLPAPPLVASPLPGRSRDVTTVESAPPRRTRSPHLPFFIINTNTFLLCKMH